MTRWLGFVVTVTAVGKDGKRKMTQLPERFATRAGAQTFLELYLRAYPAADAYITPLLKDSKEKRA